MDRDGNCTTEAIRSTLTSPFMMSNHCFILLVILVSFFATNLALQKLYGRNIFPNSTRILLCSAIANGVIHQLTVAEIRLRTIFRALAYGSDACAIQFHSSECIIEQNIYYYTNFFTSLCCISLYFDRLFSTNSKHFQQNYKFFVVLFLVFQSIIPIFLLHLVYYNVTYTGYVSMCNYPPPSIGSKFYIFNRFRFCVLGLFFILSFLTFILNRKQEKRMIHRVYDTISRYKSYENLLATKAVCIIIIVQIICLATTAIATEQIRMHTDIFPETIVDPLTGFMMGLTYSNFFLPIIICYQSNQISKRRRRNIGKMKNQKEGFLDHFTTLDFLWNRKKNFD